MGCATPAISVWMPDVIALTECGSLDLSNCQLQDDNPEIGTASFSWNLKPKFAKGKHKHK
jgi:hypothetical protein